MWRRHLSKIAEASNDGFEIVELRQKSRGTLAENFVELLGRSLARPLQIFDGDLQGKQRVFQFMREPPGEFAPRGDALGLNHTIALLDKLFSHPVEILSELAHFVARFDRSTSIPIATRYFAHSGRQVANGPGHA